RPTARPPMRMRRPWPTRKKPATDRPAFALPVFATRSVRVKASPGCLTVGAALAAVTTRSGRGPRAAAAPFSTTAAAQVVAAATSASAPRAKLTAPRGSMAVRRAGVGEGLTGDRYELPVVARRVQREPQDAERVAVADLAVRLDRAPADQALAAGPHYELADAAGRVRDGAGRLRGEALVHVVVPAEDQVRVRVVEVLEDRAHVRVATRLARA